MVKKCYFAYPVVKKLEDALVLIFRIPGWRWGIKDGGQKTMQRLEDIEKLPQEEDKVPIF